ncbi:hypothetical protein [Microbulbifer hydrolyticus]|uniref:THUMP domain-containing protein n=1 Tax=Microbulbifer hydrolyticus TaxID=48074 RepID=A0A6P1T748_9GAMM|nr:hypothetical protein [Microbulbifer hydrolyticus]MBB5211398.1 hypothetical protein [Microbulbifer hydrolyticus]QHQ37847.1 hypothetical protein GTQ55_01780 [Microbulbifer hydrolyticus]
MSTKSFQVVFTGKLCSGKDRREAIAELANRFRLDFKRINHLLSSDRVIVKRCASQAEAASLVRAFAKTGWEAQVHESPAVTGDEKIAGKVDSVKEAFRTITASDDSCVLKVPTHWQAMEGLNDGAIIQAGSLVENVFCVVLSQQVSLSETDESLNDYCSAQLQQCAKQVSSGVVTRQTEKLPPEEGGGCVGEITAEIGGVPVAYLVACVRRGNRIFTQFLWCELREYRHKRKLLRKVSASFDVLAQSVGDREAQPHAKVIPLY